MIERLDTLTGPVDILFGSRGCFGFFGVLAAGGCGCCCSPLVPVIFSSEICAVFITLAVWRLSSSRATLAKLGIWQIDEQIHQI